MEERTNTFEYSFPICDDIEGNNEDDEENIDSSKSTPYYTPMECCTSSFVFPSPKPIDKTNKSSIAASASKTTITTHQQDNPEKSVSPTKNQEQMNFMRQIKQTPTTTATSPAVSRKMRRFSSNERRSLSPQHVLAKNVVVTPEPTANPNANPTPSPVPPIHDKENAAPKKFYEQRFDEQMQMVSKSDNKSPIILKDDSVSPKVLASNFSPKLLASINNLKLTNSPLINSAGYKNGNYFKFPEIDNVVQQQQQQQQQSGSSQETDLVSPKYDNQFRNISKQYACSTIPNQSSTEQQMSIKAKTKDAEAELYSTGLRKNRKNKNNLTIKITNTLSSEVMTPSDALLPTPTPSPSPTPKPKTPTIKNTKEKALSLDSAAQCDKSLEIVIQSGESVGLTHVSCDEIDSKANLTHAEQSVVKLRQRTTGGNDFLRPAALSATTSKQSLCSTSGSPANYRSGHKPSPLLHSSNKNLKTLPEFLTLVEFSNTSPKERDQYPFKQKSMDLPSSSVKSSAALAQTPVLRNKIAASSSGSLLQRRGSNHSLTLNLHGSCSNLVGSCRTGLSASNFSLGSVASSTSNLNIKAPQPQPPAAAAVTATGSLRLAGPEIATPSTFQPTSTSTVGQSLSSQGLKQSLFRRRGSNQSLSLKSSTTTSCGNLNIFTSQNSLYVDRLSSTPLSGGSGGVTRTTSFITPTKNTASSTQTPKRGLLERRGSNQSLTLNMSSSFGGIGAERQNYVADEPSALPRAVHNSVNSMLAPPPPQCCAQHHRKFFSSENLNKSNTQFSDLCENKHVANRPFGSASDLKVSGDFTANNSNLPTTIAVGTGTGTGQHLVGASFGMGDDTNVASNVCTCSGMRNIMTRPLSPQRKAEEFKIYLANIQTLQNASNALRQNDLIKLNYIFDNSYATTTTTTTNNKSLQDVLPLVLSVDPASRQDGAGTPRTARASTDGGDGGDAGGCCFMATTSEDLEVTMRYEEVVRPILDTLSIDVDQQKRIFCDLHKEFWDLPLNHQEKPLVFGSQTKNRYKTILPNETTRVLLQNESFQLKTMRETKLAASPTAAATAAAINSVEKISSYDSGNKLLIASAETPYINANYIKGPDATSYSYVATQGPLSNTIFEFWLMVFQNIQNQKNDNEHCTTLLNKMGGGAGALKQYYQKIIMLTNFLEHHRQKCAVYFPIELNEIFIAASKQEIVPANQHLTAFFDEYLQNREPVDETLTSCAIDEFELHHINEHVRASLPKTGNVFAIKNVGIVRKNGFSIRKMIGLYCLINANNNDDDEARQVQMLIKRFCCYHYWYPDWPDHRSPRDINTLLDISLHILNLGKCEAEFDSVMATTTTPFKAHIAAQSIEFYQHDLFNLLQPYPIIHCSAGVGRTGCLTAILNGVRQMRLSLAYSLSSMAADIMSTTSPTAAVSSSLLSKTQPLSPIDFRLPTEFFNSLPTTDDDDDDDTASQIQFECNTINDTDSSFTYNTLLYIRFIADKFKSMQNASSHPPSKAMKLKLTALPRMPDIIVDILGIVCNLRLSRGGMVQNSEQYELIHRALCLYLKRTFALKRF